MAGLINYEGRSMRACEADQNKERGVLKKKNKERGKIKGKASTCMQKVIKQRRGGSGMCVFLACVTWEQSELVTHSDRRWHG